MREAHCAISRAYLSGKEMQLALMQAIAYTIAIGRANGARPLEEERTMKVWTKPAVREQEVGLEVTSYMPAEIDII
jgi:coenzyme PQQ precursor peptide PqqA